MNIHHKILSLNDKVTIELGSPSSFHYTVHRYPDIDEVVERHMKIIVDEITKTLEDVDSIVLSGGFGRGEGSVKRQSDGTIIPMNDYDLFVFTDDSIPFGVFQRLTKRLRERVGVDVDLKFIPVAKVKNLIPDLWAFELKTASNVVWGKDFRAKIDMTKEDIPLSVGLNALFIRNIGLVNPECFEPQFLTKGFFGWKRTLMEYEASKTFLEICTALCLLGGFYAPSYLQRAHLLRQNYSKAFSELSDTLPSLAEDIEFYTQYKLMALETGRLDITKLWLKARDELRIVMSFFICRIFALSFKPNPDLANLLLTRRRQLAEFYFRPYICCALKRIGIPPWSFLVKSAIPMVRLYENTRYMRSCHNVVGKAYLNPLLTFRSPLIDIYVSIALMALAIQNDTMPDGRCVKEAYNIISSMFPCQKLADEDLRTVSGWRAVRDAAASSFKTYASPATAMTF